MKDKLRILARLLKEGSITEDEFLVLMETEKETQIIPNHPVVEYPWMQPLPPWTPPQPTWCEIKYGTFELGKLDNTIN